MKQYSCFEFVSWIFLGMNVKPLLFIFENLEVVIVEYE